LFAETEVLLGEEVHLAQDDHLIVEQRLLDAGAGAVVEGAEQRCKSRRMNDLGRGAHEVPG
jgi:hypothetical protein